MKLKLKTMTLLASALVAVASMAQSPISVHWEMGKNNAKKGWYSSQFIIKNTSNKTLDSNWIFCFNQFTRSYEWADNSQVDIDDVSTSYYQIKPNENYRPMAPGDTIVLNILFAGTLMSECYAPMGGHVILNDDYTHPIPAKLTRSELGTPDQISRNPLYPDGNYMYDYNNAINNIGDAYTGNDYDIFPTPKSVEINDGITHIGNIVTIKSKLTLKKGNFLKKDKATRLLTEELKNRGIYTADRQDVVISIKINKKLNANSEYYTLDVKNGKIDIVGSTEEGAVNGVKTLIAAIDHSKGHNLQNAHIVDYPDLHYRGYMLDIARNFTNYSNMKRFIELMSYYKLNRLQFHFADDEGWRVEIPGLPELTTYGSRRGATVTAKDYMAPIFESNGDPNDLTQSANGYISRSQFIDLLRFADLRGVKIIPEIDTPGHSFAAIMSMKNRYNKYIGSNRAAAEEYQLWDPNDNTNTASVQGYCSNVLDVANQGVYNFVSKVISELELMYKEAGLTLDIVHIGGDEVPRGAWDSSPDIKNLMQREGLKNDHEVLEYYVTRVGNMLYDRGIRIEGWQEVGVNHSKEWLEKNVPHFAGINSWSTQGSRDTLTYSLANQGFPVILSNCTNFYMDMVYTWHQYDKGLNWSGKIDEFDSWSALPWNIYASPRTDYLGRTLDILNAGNGKTKLQKPENIIGVQGQLWAETIRDFDQVQYMTLPKAFGLFERGWNSNPEWSKDLSNREMYDSARHQYNLKIGTRELPVLKARGYNFRIGQPGVKIVDGKLIANTQYPGVEVHYTLDGSEPSTQSPLWTAPVKVGDYKVIKAKAYYLGKESLTTYLFKK